MTARTIFVGLQRTLVTIVLAGSGAYLLIYLYRWEWNRALISGLVFVAAEIALATSLLLHRIVEGAGHDESHRAPSFDLALRRLREANVDRSHPFRWLEPDGFGVFIPVLLGAGVVLSALAYVVEHIAESTAHVTVDRRLARRLSVLVDAPRPRGRRPVLPWTPAPRRVGPMVGLAAAAVMTLLVLQVLAEATQSRADPSDRPAETTVVLRVEQRERESTLDAAAALWVACRPVLASVGRPVADVVPTGDDTVRIVLHPGIRDLEVRRLTGCLADATLTSVRADVLEVT